MGGMDEMDGLQQQDTMNDCLGSGWSTWADHKTAGAAGSLVLGESCGLSWDRLEAEIHRRYPRDDVKEF